MGRRMRPRYLPDLSVAEAMTPSTNQKARTEHFGRASQPPPVHPRLEVGGAMLRAIQRGVRRPGCYVPERAGPLSRFCRQRARPVVALAVAPGPVQLAVGCALDPAAAEIIAAPAPGVVELVAGDDAFELGDAHAEVVPAAHGLRLALEGHAEVELRLGIAPLADIVAVERLPRRRRDDGGRAGAAELRDGRRLAGQAHGFADVRVVE